MRSPWIRVPPVNTAPLGMRRSSTAIASSRRTRRACPSDTVCVPCTQAAMVLRSDTGVLPTGVWKPVFLSSDVPAMKSPSLTGCAREDTTSCRIRLTGLTDVLSFRSSVGVTEGVCLPLYRAASSYDFSIRAIFSSNDCSWDGPMFCLFSSSLIRRSSSSSREVSRGV